MAPVDRRLCLRVKIFWGKLCTKQCKTHSFASLVAFGGFCAPVKSTFVLFIDLKFLKKKLKKKR